MLLKVVGKKGLKITPNNFLLVDLRAGLWAISLPLQIVDQLNRMIWKIILNVENCFPCLYTVNKRGYFGSATLLLHTHGHQKKVARHIPEESRNAHPDKMRSWPIHTQTHAHVFNVCDPVHSLSSRLFPLVF